MTDRCGPILRVLAVAMTLLLLGGAAAAEGQFEKAVIYLERNVGDDDIESGVIVGCRCGRRGVAGDRRAANV